MACGQGSSRGQVYGQVLSTVLAHKQECLQYLTVDTDTYMHWRTLARSLELATDCDVAAFLLQHYEKTSDLQLTQCVKCEGPVVQYCVPCNIYMTQPTTASTLLQQQEAATGEGVVIPGDTILIDATSDGEVESAAVVAVPQQSSEAEESEQQLVMVKADNLADDVVEVGEVRGQTMSANQLEALVEACAMQGAIVTPETTLNPHTTANTTPSTTTTTTTTTIKSLLTPEILKKLKSQTTPPAKPGSSQQKAEPLLQAEIGSLVTTAAELSGLTTMAAAASSQPITVSQLTTVPASQSVVTAEGVLRLVDSQGNTIVVGADCLEIEAPQGQLLAGTSGGVAAAETLLEVATEAAGIGARSDDLSSCLHDVVPKKDLSDDESDYYCEPLFKPEKSEDEDLQTAINILEGKVTSSSSISGGVQLGTGLTQGGCIKITQRETTQDSTVVHSAGTDAETAAETAHSAIPDSDSTDVFIGDTADADSERSDSAKAAEKTNEVSNSELEGGESADPEMETGKVVRTDAERSEPSVSLSDTQTDQSAGSVRKRGRKRKREPDSPDPDSSPAPSPQKTALTPAVNHTMRTRFFDKKRPSFVPLASPPASPLKGQSSGRGRRGRKPGSGRKENAQQEEEQGRGRKKRTAVKGELSDFDDDDNDPDYQPDHREDEKDEVPDSGSKSNKESGGDRSGKDKHPSSGRQQDSARKDPTADTSRPEKKLPAASTTEETEKKPDLKNQVIVITEKEDLDNLSLPVVVRVQSLPSGSGSDPKVKTEGGLAVVKTETNIAPLEVGAPQTSRLASRVSIVTGDDDNDDGGDVKPPRKKRRLHSKLSAKTYACDMCEEQMGSRGELKRHLQQHHGTRPYACPKCPATYKNRSHLRVHLNRHAEVKPFQCKHCPKNFASNYALTAHLTTHSTERPEKCDICGRTFKSAKYLKGHRLLHEPVEKRFICQQCGARFNRKSNLLNHIKIHNNDKQYECPHCTRRFIQSGSLKSHMFRMHNPQRARPYVCEICGAARYAKDQFEKHMMIHTNTKPFKCEACGAAFVQSNALKGHMKIHTETEGKSHWCSICGAAFKKFASLKKHVHKIHNEYPDVSLTTVEFIEIQV